MKKIKVSLKERSYNIYIGYNVLSHAGRIISENGLEGHGIIITDKNVKRYWLDTLQKGLRKPLPVYTITPGERSKSLAVAENIYLYLLKKGLDRHSFIIALGGGVVGDLAGFVAATFMRGIPYVQIPTTLMAQVDSSIGGKTGVNLPHGKNLVGCFHQPKCIITDIMTLTTLPRNELKAGMAEVIKYGVIKDAGLFKFLEEKNLELFDIGKKLLEPVITKCAKIKADIVSKDEKETKGLRVILNYGHTIGHAIETADSYKGLTHGEAVALGMVIAARLSNSLGYLSEEEKNRQVRLIDKLINTKRTIECGDIINRLRYDKKAKGGRPRFVLAKKNGKVIVTDKVSEEDIRTAL